MPRDCFVVGPIGAADSPVRIHADWLLDEIIGPVMSRFPEFTVHRADKLSQPGLIDTQVITFLLNADLVIADITTLNPNAFYEIGIRHMVQKPIIHMHKVGEKIPFDISAYRSIEFSLERPSDLKDARSRLQSAVEAVLAEGYKVDNPVTHARGVVHLQEQATDAQRILLDEMEGIKERLNKIESAPSNIILVGDGRQNPFRENGWVRMINMETAPSKTKPWDSNTVDAKAALSSLFGTSYPDLSDTLQRRIEEAARDEDKDKEP